VDYTKGIKFRTVEGHRDLYGYVEHRPDNYCKCDERYAFEVNFNAYDEEGKHIFNRSYSPEMLHLAFTSGKWFIVN